MPLISQLSRYTKKQSGNPTIRQFDNLQSNLQSEIFHLKSARIRVNQWLRGFCLLALLSSAHAGIIEDVRTSLDARNFQQATVQLRAYRAAHGATPEYLEAYSWTARAQLAARNYDQANAAANTTERLVLAYLKQHKLDKESHAPLALGAALEVQAQALAAQGQRSEAVALLDRSIRTYKNTSILARLEKNRNLLALTGQSAPALDLAEHLGPAPRPLAQLHGSPIFLFFWAHWCGDCKNEAPVLARLKSEYVPKGFLFLAPTKRYGYAASGEDATPAAELAYIEQVRERYYSVLADVPVPVSAANFNTYGASTTPTLVVINRAGKVVLYHPGYLPYESLKPALDQALQ
jgi:thiol-disulfide isomerase/thioredoxin